jgi:uncharacterized NAD(P)/FAD-binding protein YdhS
VRTVAVIGAGFSGTLTAVHLLREAPGDLRVVLINASGRLARGLAYGTRSAWHVLNVPTGNMSALPDDPEHFLRYCRWRDPAIGPGDFVARGTYGSYLDALLTAAEQGAREGVSLECRAGQVLALRRPLPRGPVDLLMHDGSRIEADHVVLAFGHFPPADPPTLTDAVRASGRYLRDPWAPGGLDAIGPDDPVVVLGSGLTALDIVLALHQGERRARTVCLSRRGLQPLPHRVGLAARPVAEITDLLPALHSGPLPALRALRRATAAARARGEDWRDVLAALRPVTPALWQAWPQAARARFLRHLQAHWDVHRHRCAPALHERWRALQHDGRVEVMAGRLLDMGVHDGALVLGWRRRGDAVRQEMRPSWLVNCTGPDSRLQRAGSAVIDDLVSQGLVTPDPLGLGLSTDDDHTVLRRDGSRCTWLHYVGPLRKARDWEATAVPELREQARSVASNLLALLSAGPRVSA